MSSKNQAEDNTPSGTKPPSGTEGNSNTYQDTNKTTKTITKDKINNQTKTREKHKLNDTEYSNLTITNDDVYSHKSIGNKQKETQEWSSTISNNENSITRLNDDTKNTDDFDLPIFSREIFNPHKGDNLEKKTRMSADSFIKTLIA
jgi:hypothetical protein